MTAHPPALLDSDTLSEIMKGRDQNVLARADEYLHEHRELQLSIITRYEILRGPSAKGAVRQTAAFLQQCRKSTIHPVTEEIADRAAEIPLAGGLVIPQSHLTDQGNSAGETSPSERIALGTIVECRLQGNGQGRFVVAASYSLG